MNILVTLDYELFNGREGGTVQNCLIKPLDAFISIISRYNCHVTLFVDACFLLRLKELKDQMDFLKKDWDSISNQLRNLSKQGHSIQLHLHPQWLNANVKNGRWYSDLSLYKLSDLPNDDAVKLFNEGCGLIEEITGVKPIAFRAGDYCVQTFQGLCSAFDKNGILIDSSVLRGKFSINEREWFDYRRIPREYSYRFTKSVTDKDINGRFWEISIPTYAHSLIDIYLRKNKLKKYGRSNVKWGDGTSSTGGQMLSPSRKILHYINYIFKKNKMSASVDGISASYLSEIYKQEKRKGAPYMLIMGHPKTFTPTYINLFEEFIQGVTAEDKICTINKMIEK